MTTEAQFQSAVIDLARLRGFIVAHFRPSLTQSGRWATAVQADGAGFPDLVIVGHGLVLYREIKTDRGRLSTAQIRWLAELEDADQDVDVWRPRDWPLIEATLARRNPPTRRDWRPATRSVTP